MSNTQTRSQAGHRTDGMKRGRVFNASPAADSPAELELKALESARVYFGQFARLELAEDYSASERWASVITGEHASPMYRGLIPVYELVPDPERPTGYER